MVYLRAVTPALAELLDAAAVHATADEIRRDLIFERLYALVQTQPPSQLENALWILLVAQQQLLLRLRASSSPSSSPPQQQSMGETAGATPAEQHPSPSKICPLPLSLQIPTSVCTISDAVRWYCEELPLPPDDLASGSPGTGDAAASPAAAPPSRQSRAAMPSPANPPLQLSTGGRCGARLDEALRHRGARQSPAGAAPVTPTRPGSTGPLATVELAIDAFSQPKRAAALRQPRTIALFLRDAASLWSLIHLCKRLRLRHLCKERLLTGVPLAVPGPCNANGRADGRKGVEAVTAHTSGNGYCCFCQSPLEATERIAVCFHDYELLIPWDRLQVALSLALQADPSNAPFSIAAVAALCRDREAAHQWAAGGAALPSFTLIISPAVTPLTENPDRLRKNARIDAIDEAVQKYNYAVLTSGAHGQGRAAPSTSGSAGGTTAAASAAMQQEALRHAIGAVDAGEYGVLDPSRRRAPPSLSPNASATSANAETIAATSYASFLRDASIGFDIQVMALTGAGVGYYLGHLRGLSSEWCTLYAVVGLVVMMLVDAVLLLIRVGRQDEAVRSARQRVQRQRAKVEREGEKLVRLLQATAALGVAEASPSPRCSVSSAQTHRSSPKDAFAVVQAEPVSTHTKKTQ